MKKPVKKVINIGGGTAGWLAAAALSERLKQQALLNPLVESDQVGTVGVGEAIVREIMRPLQPGIEQSWIAMYNGVNRFPGNCDDKRCQVHGKFRKVYEYFCVG